jgi:hypothetical protein
MKALFFAPAALICLYAVLESQPKVDIEREKAELRRMHERDREAHFARDVESLVSTFAPEMLNIRDGQVLTRTRDENRRRLQEYFQGAEFSEWDDLMPPIIRISPDGQMAWMIVRIKGKYTRTVAAGAKTQEEFVCAWMSTYEKQGSTWIHVANASTFQSP